MLNVPSNNDSKLLSEFTARYSHGYSARASELKRCTRCICDESIPGISFDTDGVCNFCATHDQLAAEYPTGEEGRKKLDSIFEQIKKEGRGKPYDCVIGVSGGCDSSYILYLAKEAGLRPLAVHFDNTWNSTVATENIHTMLSALNFDLYTVVVNNKEYDDLYRAFIRAGVPDIEIPTDIGFASTLFQAARKFKIPNVLEGHSFRTEGVAPLGWIYMDGKYISSVSKQFGTMPLKTYPNMPLSSFLRRLLFTRTKKIRPLYYIDYDKPAVKDFLQREYGWKWYGGHHLENRFTAFFHSFFWPYRFGFDDRTIEYSAHIRSGQMTREESMQDIVKPREFDPEIVELVKKRLELSDREFYDLMTIPRKCYLDFPTYKKTFELMRPFFHLMYKSQLVPKSFYLKYCFPQERPAWAS